MLDDSKVSEHAPWEGMPPDLWATMVLNEARKAYQRGTISTVTMQRLLHARAVDDYAGMVKVVKTDIMPKVERYFQLLSRFLGIEVPE
jgi:hypothetical protein